ncbi:hypothetical protein chiPu_0005346 [Chiloscyllium punctatum]|uniref:Uncharacterized protein n=1 Tax=Chiloscyllium punctatum TaxID=137246 RepID=A0A401S974_CHIPU|nr:hypothetical protein [Chiloscyllium punctatum]
MGLVQCRLEIQCEEAARGLVQCRLEIQCEEAAMGLVQCRLEIQCEEAAMGLVQCRLEIQREEAARGLVQCRLEIQCEEAAVNLRIPGEMKEIETKLHLKWEAGPWSMKTRPVPFAIRLKVEAELEQPVNLGALEPVTASE